MKGAKTKQNGVQFMADETTLNALKYYIKECDNQMFGAVNIDEAAFWEGEKLKVQVQINHIQGQLSKPEGDFYF